VPPVVLAVDQGSSSSRCVVLDGQLRPLAIASGPLASFYPAPGWVEHDPAQIVASVLASIAGALSQAAAAWGDVAGLGLAAQTETFVVWDRATGAAVYPAISWRDGRAAALCDRLRAGGREDRIRDLTGLPLGPAFSAAKLRWVLDEVPGGQRRAAAGELAFGDVNSWLTWHLSGGAAHVTDPSMAARTMLFDLAAGDWSAELLADFGIPAPLLPAIAPTAGRLAMTDPGVCGGRMVIGASIGDQQAALFGQRCWSSGMAKLTLGTGAFLWCHAGSAPPAAVPRGVVSSCAWQLPGDTAYALEGFVPNAGGVTTWLRQVGALAAHEWPVISDSAPGHLAGDNGPRSQGPRGQGAGGQGAGGQGPGGQGPRGQGAGGQGTGGHGPGGHGPGGHGSGGQGAGSAGAGRDGAGHQRAGGDGANSPAAGGLAAGLWCVPALFGLGTPHWVATAQADITGLTPASTGADLAQAAMLGVVHQIVDAIDAVQLGLPGPLRLVRADGGLAGNDSVVQAIANLSGISLERPAVTEATALGAGALAGLGTGLWDRATLAGLPFELGTTVSPALPEDRRAAARAGWAAALSAALARWPEAGK
jgi:glycerol kinase